MSDTSIEVTSLLAREYAARPPAERVRMAAMMFGTARKLVQAGIRSQHAGITDVELRVQVLQRLYGDELTPAAIEAIAKSVDNPKPNR